MSLCRGVTCRGTGHVKIHCYAVEEGGLLGSQAIRGGKEEAEAGAKDAAPGVGSIYMTACVAWNSVGIFMFDRDGG